MPASSETGMKAPERPPTLELAITPPFLTASFNIARAHVVPGPPQVPTPMISRMRATESPTAGGGARERSTMPFSTPRRREASRLMSSPARVILKAVCLIFSATSIIEAVSGSFSRAAAMTPGPETPTLITASASPPPCTAPAIKGESSTMLAKQTNLEAPTDSWSAVSLAESMMVWAAMSTASILMPARRLATFMDEQTRLVPASASGMD
ncbi:unknown [Collinsella sp. CAG:289]|nr:unknown [Collinsella sp. CAG:289]